MHKRGQRVIGVALALLMITAIGSTGSSAATIAEDGTDRPTAAERFGAPQGMAPIGAVPGVAPPDRSAANDSRRPVASASTLVVEPGNPANYDTIQNAVDNATDGDTVEIRSGTYNKNLPVTVDKSITLTAPNGATIDKTSTFGEQASIDITDGAAPTITGLTLKDPVRMDDSLDDSASAGDWVIRDVTFSDFRGTAIDASFSTGDWTIRNTRISHETSGVDARSSVGDWTIRDTTFNGSGSFEAVDASLSEGDWTIRGATMTNRGVLATNTNGTWTIEDTTITDADIQDEAAEPAASVIVDSYGDWTIRDVTITDSGGMGVIVTPDHETSDLPISSRPVSGNWAIRNMTIADSNGDGVDITNAPGAWTIRNSTITNSTGTLASGVEAEGSGNWTIQDVEITDSDDNGIFAEGDGWTIRNVTIRNSGDQGVTTEDGPWTIQNTTIANSGENGLNPAKFGVDEWTVRNTTITSSGTNGINAEGTEYNWTVRNVTITDNQRGVDARNSEGAWAIRNATIKNNTGAGVHAGANFNGGSTGDWLIQGTTITANSGAGVNAEQAGGDWRIRDATIADSGSVGVNARHTTGAWSIHRTTITNNTRTAQVAASGIDATGADIEGDATRNWWGDASGPDANDCAGSVDCSDWLTSPTGGGNQPPTAAFDHAPTSPAVNESVTFNASASSDPDGAIASYAWDFDDDGTTDATGVTATHAFTSAGNHTVSLSVTDTAGASTTTSATIAVANASTGPGTGPGSGPGRYAGGDDRIQASELRQAIGDWVRGSIDTSLLRRIITAWVRQSTV